MLPQTFVFVWEGDGPAPLNYETVTRAISDATGVSRDEVVQMRVVLYATGVRVTSLTSGQVYRLVPIAKEEVEE